MRNERKEIKDVYKKVIANVYREYRFENVDYNEFVDFGDTFISVRVNLKESLNKIDAIVRATDVIYKLSEYVDGDILDVKIKHSHVGVTNGENQEAIYIEIEIDGECVSKNLIGGKQNEN